MENLFITDYELFKFYEKSKKKSNWYFLLMFAFAAITAIYTLAHLDILPGQRYLPFNEDLFLYVAIISAIIQGVLGGLALIYKRTSSYLMDGKATLSIRGLLSTIIGLLFIPLLVAFTMSRTKKL